MRACLRRNPAWFAEAAGRCGVCRTDLHVIGDEQPEPVLPIVVLMRPHELTKPFKRLALRPAKDVWGDPLGGHQAAGARSAGRHAARGWS